ncbi:MAG: DUF4130 domain-containing protein [Clostridia bacterium]|nr:DUF4130 domain-containing protein [Clostridia bacterium]
MLNSTVNKFSYDGTIEGFLSVFDYCIENKVMPVNIKPDYLVYGTIIEREYLRIPTNYQLADRMYRLVGRRSSPEVQQMMSDCFLTSLPDMEMDLFIMICKAIKYGAVIAEDYKDQLLHRIQFAIRDLYREAHSVVHAVNAVKIDDVSYAIINPRNNVLPIIEKSLLNNYDYDDFIVYDKRHHIALLRIDDRNSMVDIKRIMTCEVNSIEDLRSRIWVYFRETTNMPARDVRGMRADSLTRLWYIAS